MPPQTCWSARFWLRQVRGRIASRGWAGAGRRRLPISKVRSRRTRVTPAAPSRDQRRGDGDGGEGREGLTGSANGSTLTGFRKRYPRRGIVSTKPGEVAESPSARRISLMEKLRLASKSTNASPQTSWRISSRLITSPERLARISRTLAGCGWSLTGEPARSSSPLSSRSSKSSKRRRGARSPPWPSRGGGFIATCLYVGLLREF